MSASTTSGAGRARGAASACDQLAAVARLRCSVARQSARPGARRASEAARRAAARTPGAARAAARLRGAPLVGAHGLEVGVAQQLALAPGERGVELDRLFGGSARGAALVRSGTAPRRGAGSRASVAARRLRLHARQQHRQHAAEQVGVAPEDVERLVEQRAVLGAVDQAGGQRRVEVAAAVEARRPAAPAARAGCGRCRPACRRRAARARSA